MTRELEISVNNSKISSITSYILQNLTYKHFNYKVISLSADEHILVDPVDDLTKNFKYYGIIFQEKDNESNMIQLEIRNHAIDITLVNKIVKYDFRLIGEEFIRYKDQIKQIVANHLIEQLNYFDQVGK